MTRSHLGLLALSTVALLACGAEPSESHDFEGPADPDTLVVTPGVTPNYAWTLGPADTLEVARTSDLSTVVWRAVSVDMDGIISPVQHNTAEPDRNITITTETTLTPGVSYRARVVRLEGSTVVTNTFVVP
jgi:hypothetical protein